MGKKHREGFTLIELLVLMMVIAVALGIGVPAFSGMVANSRMSGAANDLVASLHAARAEATTRARTVTVCASADWDAASPGCDAGGLLLDGWIVFADVDNDGAVGETDVVVQAHGPLEDSIRGAARTTIDGAAPQYVSFGPNGFAQDIAGLPPAVRNIQLCDARGDRDTGGGVAAGRWITISPAGRPALIDRVERLQGAGNPLGGC